MIPTGLTLVARAALRRAARQAVLVTAAVIVLLIGAGFLISAAWIALAEARGAVFASLVLGFCLVGLGLVILLLSRDRPRGPVSQPLQPDAAALAALSEAARGEAGDLERTLHALLSAQGLTPPATGNLPSLAAALVYGLTLGLRRDRR